MASCVKHGEWDPHFFGCPKCFKEGDVTQPIPHTPGVREALDELEHLAIVQAGTACWKAIDKHMPLLRAALLSERSATPEGQHALCPSCGSPCILHPLSSAAGITAVRTPVSAIEEPALADVLAWADGVRGALGTEHAAKVTDRELRIAHAIQTARGTDE